MSHPISYLYYMQNCCRCKVNNLFIIFRGIFRQLRQKRYRCEIAVPFILKDIELMLNFRNVGSRSFLGDRDQSLHRKGQNLVGLHSHADVTGDEGRDRNDAHGIVAIGNSQSGKHTYTKVMLYH